MTGLSFVRSVAVAAFETRIVAKGFLDGETAASPREAARGHGESSERVVIALRGVYGHDSARIEELECMVDDAREGGWGLALEAARQELRDACAVRLPFIWLRALKDRGAIASRSGGVSQRGPATVGALVAGPVGTSASVAVSAAARSLIPPSDGRR